MAVSDILSSDLKDLLYLINTLEQRARGRMPLEAYDMSLM